MPKMVRYEHSNCGRTTPLPAALVIDELQACLVVKDSAGQKLVIQI